MIPPIMVPIRPDLKGFSNALNGANTGLRRMQSITQQIGENLLMSGQNLRRAGWASLASFTAPIALIGRTAIKSFAEFDEAMTHSLAIATKTDRALRGEAEALATTLSTKLAFSAKDLADGYYHLISSGLDLEQSMRSLQPAAMFARAGNMQLAQSVEMLSDTQKALGLGYEDPITNMKAMVTVGDYLVYAAKRSNAEVVQFTQTFTNQAAAMGRAFGQNMTDMLSTMMAFADRGEKGMRLGMKMSQLLRGLSFASERASEGFAKYGLSLYDAAGKMKPLYQIIGDLEQILSRFSNAEVPGVLLDLGFTEKSLGAIMTIRGASEKIKQYRDELVQNSAGSLSDVASFQMAAFQAQVQNIKNTITMMAIDIGKKLAPYVLSFWKIALKITESVRNMSDATFNTMVKIAAGLALLGPALLFFGGINMVLGIFFIQLSKIIGVLGVFVALYKSLVGIILLSARAMIMFTVSASKGLPVVIKMVGVFSLTLIKTFAGLIASIAVATVLSLKFVGTWLARIPVLIFSITAFTLSFLKLQFQAALTMVQMTFSFELYCAKLVFGNVLLGIMTGLMAGLKAVAMGFVTVLGTIGITLLTFGPLILTAISKFKEWKKEGVSVQDFFTSLFKNIIGFAWNIKENLPIVFSEMEGQWGSLLDNMMLGLKEFVFKAVELMTSSFGTAFEKIWDRWSMAQYQRLERSTLEANLQFLNLTEAQKGEKRAELEAQQSKEVKQFWRDAVGSIWDAIPSWDSMESLPGYKKIKFDTSKLKWGMPDFSLDALMKGLPGIEGLGGVPTVPGGEGEDGMPSTAKAKSFPTWTSLGSKDWYNAILGGKTDTQRQISLLEQIADNTSMLDVTPLKPNAPEYPTIGSANEWFDRLGTPGGYGVLDTPIGTDSVLASSEDMKRYESEALQKQTEMNANIKVITELIKNHFIKIETKPTGPATVAIQ